MKFKIKLLRLLSGILIMASFVGCSTTIVPSNKKTMVDKKIIEIDGAKKATVKINMGVGELIIDKSTDKMMQGEFVYTNADWKPEVSYKVSGDEGNLDIKQPSSMGINMNMGKSEYRWDLSLNKDVPTNLDINMGVGKGEIDLREVNIKDLDVKAGVGKMSIDLSGNYKEDVKVDIKGGIGENTLYLPKNIGVRIKVEKGIGKIKEGKFKEEKDDVYVNDSYGKTENTMDIEVSVGIGEFKFELR